MKGAKSDALEIRSMAHLALCLGISPAALHDLLANPDSLYRTWSQTKKGKKRDYCEPLEPLKTALRSLNARLQKVKLPPYFYGGIRGRSNIDNAKAHGPNRTLLKADIKDFFPSIDRQRVQVMFEKKLRCSGEVARAISILCTHEDRLPQGAPTSTMIANLVVEHLAFRLHRLAQFHGATFTQFVDDISISGPSHLIQLEDLVARIIEEEGFTCHPQKLCTLGKSSEQVITGVRVDHGLDVPLEKLSDVRSEIEELAHLNSSDDELYRKSIRSIVGRIAYIGSLNKGLGKQLSCRLNEVLGDAGLSGQVNRA